MYEPIRTHSAFVHDDEMAVYGPRDHQRVIAKLTTGLGLLYYREKTISLEPLPETMLDEGEASPAPDLILSNNTTDETLVIIEVCHTKGLKRDLKKVIALVDAAEYGIQEAFVYDYKSSQWFRYGLGDVGLTTQSSLSSVLGLDLNQFL